MEDLNFSDFNRQMISKNGIKKTYMMAKLDSFLDKKNDTLGVIEYYNRGNITRRASKKVLGGYRVKYIYDSVGLPIQKNYITDFDAEFHYRYEFSPEDLILYKHYREPRPLDLHQSAPKTSAVFKFNTNGILIESTAYQDHDYGAGAKFVTTYHYDSSDLLLSKEVQADLRQVTDTLSQWFWPYKNTTKYYYTDKHIDSSITVYYYLDEAKTEKSYRQKAVYDHKGLICKTVEMGRFVTIFKHH